MLLKRCRIPLNSTVCKKNNRTYNAISGVIFELGAVTVDPMTPTFNPEPLIPYLAGLGVPYFFEKQGILKKAEEMEEVNSICR